MDQHTPQKPMDHEDELLAKLLEILTGLAGLHREMLQIIETTSSYVQLLKKARK